MADQKISQLTALATADQADVYAIVDTSASETKKITQQDVEDTIANSTNFVDQLVANNYFTTELAGSSNFVNELTQNTSFQSAVNNFVTVVGGGGSGVDGKPQSIIMPFATENAYVVSGYTDRLAYFYRSNTPSVGANTFYLQTTDGYIQNRQYQSDMASANSVRGFALIGQYLYVLLAQSGVGNAALYRYDATNLAGGGTLMTISGASLTGTTMNMTSNGTHLFFNRDAGNSANAYAITKFSISGTTATYVATVNAGSTESQFNSGYWFVDSSENYYGWGNTSSGNSGGAGIFKYDSTGASVENFPETHGDYNTVLNYSDTIYGLSDVGGTSDDKKMFVKLLIKNTDLVPVFPIIDKHTTVGGSASEVITVTGVTTTNKVFCQLTDNGTNNVSIVTADCTGADQVTVVFSADPGNDAELNYIVYE